jgi:hypothetical protein
MEDIFMKKLSFLLVGLLVLAFALPLEAQYKDQGGFGGGIGFGGVYGQTDLKSGGDFLARAYMRFALVRGIQGELGAGLGTISGPTYETRIIPMDFRFLFHPLASQTWNPYLYAGFGMMHYDIQKLPPVPVGLTNMSQWTGYVPA